MRHTELDWNKPLLLRYRTSRLARWKTLALIAWLKLREVPPPVKGALLLMLLVLVTLLAGCAGISMPPSESARNPSPPPSVLPESSPGYLQRALSDISAWRSKLTELTQRLAP